jgi:hypothetical protein
LTLGGSEAIRAGSRSFYTPDSLDDVEPRLLVDIDDDRAFVLQPSGLFGIFCSIDRGSNIGDADRRAVFIGDDEFRVGVGIENLVGGVENDRAMGTVEIAFGPIYG